MDTITLSNKEGWRKTLYPQSGAICRAGRGEETHIEDGSLRLKSQFSATEILNGMGGKVNHTANAIGPLSSQVQ